jgi:hypothetical protein
MKDLKIASFLVIAAASLMAFAGSAPAAGTFTSPTGTAYRGRMEATLEGTSLLKAGFAEITCFESVVEVEITTNNEEHATGPTVAMFFPYYSCTSPQGTPTVTTLSSKGTLTIRKGTHAVSGTGVEVTTAVIGTSCVYGMGTGTSLGTANNTTFAGSDQVTLAISAKLPKISGGFLCASPAAWTASYVVTEPSTSFVD